MSNESLATELLQELKASARRWFIAFCIMVGLEVSTIVGFVWYTTLPIEETIYTQETECLDNGSRSHQIINEGEYNGESETDSTKD